MNVRARDPDLGQPAQSSELRDGLGDGFALALVGLGTNVFDLAGEIASLFNPWKICEVEPQSCILRA